MMMIGREENLVALKSVRLQMKTNDTEEMKERWRRWKERDVGVKWAVTSHFLSPKALVTNGLYNSKHKRTCY